MTNDEIAFFLVGIPILFFIVFFIFYLSGVDTQSDYEEFQKSAHRRPYHTNKKSKPNSYKERGWIDDGGNINADTLDKNGNVIETRVKEKKKLTLQEQYQLLLQMPEWKEKRLQIIKRDGYRCQWCNTTNNLQVHHKWYCKTKNGLRRNPWDYDDNVFMTLCGHCHKRYHEKYEVKTFCCGCSTKNGIFRTKIRGFIN